MSEYTDELELEFNNYVLYIFILVQNNNEFKYYFSNKDDWQMDNWQYMDNESNIDFIINAMNKVRDDEINVDVIIKEYTRLKSLKNEFAMQVHLPMLYVNFDTKELKSRYHEQALEDRIINGWVGTYENFLSLVPDKLKYWDESYEQNAK